MNAKRIAAVILTLVLSALLGWSIFAGVGDLRTRIILCVGIALGLLYATMGRLPAWILDLADGRITDDDDPSNIPPRVYLPILFGVIAIAVIGFVVVLRFP